MEESRNIRLLIARAGFAARYVRVNAKEVNVPVVDFVRAKLGLPRLNQPERQAGLQTKVTISISHSEYETLAAEATLNDLAVAEYVRWKMSGKRGRRWRSHDRGEALPLHEIERLRALVGIPADYRGPSDQRVAIHRVPNPICGLWGK